MKLIVEKSYFSNALSVAGRAVSHRNTLPILGNVLIESHGDKITLTATDLDTGIKATIPAQIAEQGAVAIPAGVLNDIVSKLPDAPITLEVDGGKAKVRSGKSDYMILSLPAADYPVVPSVHDGQEITLLQSELKRLLQLTIFAASKEETRSILMGVLFELRSKELRLVATDTHRLAMATSEMTGERSPVSVIVPAKPLAELQSLLNAKNDGEVTIRFGQSQVQFETPDVTLVSRVLDGQFPNYEKVIPKELSRVIIANRSELLGALRRVYIVAKQNSEKVVMRSKANVIELTAESADVGQAYEEVPVTTQGDDTKMAFNCRYLIEVCGLLDSETVQLQLAGALNPGLLKADGTDGFLQVIMPMAA